MAFSAQVESKGKKKMALAPRTQGILMSTQFTAGPKALGVFTLDTALKKVIDP